MLKQLILGVFIAFCITCSHSTNNILPFPEDVPFVAFPPPVPASDLPEYEEYHIRTRIIIEMLVMPAIPGKNEETSIYGANVDDVKKELDIAERIFKDIGLKFDVEQYVYQVYEDDYVLFKLDALRYPSCLSIYFMLPNGFAYNGIASPPWEKLPWGVFIALTRNNYTLAHELGHYFGLLHPFDEDFCKDTPPQEQEVCNGEKGGTENCGNIMSYCVHTPKSMTSCQVERMKRFLRTTRRSQIIINPLTNTDRVKKLFDRFFPVPTSQPTSQPSIIQHGIHSQNSIGRWFDCLD